VKTSIPGSGRYCVIGSSFIGAVRVAYARAPQLAAPWRFDFWGRPQPDFKDMDIVDGRITGARFHAAEGSGHIADYDGFFLYGDLLNPYEVLALEVRLKGQGFSSQVREAVIEDRLKASGDARMKDRLHFQTEAPVWMLSRVTHRQNHQLKTQDEYNWGLEQLHRHIGALTHLDMPELLDERFVTRTELSVGSLNLEGGATTAETADCDLQHLNEAGGRVVLAAMMRAIATTRVSEIAEVATDPTVGRPSWRFWQKR